MYKNIILVMKGIIIGFGKIIPGVSGSVLAIFLNVYEDSINAISHLFKDFKNNVTYLGYLGVGIIFSIILGSKILMYFFSKYYFYTFSFIIGLIVGTIPNIIKNIKIKSKQDYVYIIIPFIIIWIINNLKLNISITNNYLVYFFIGLIEAATTIIPGISSTAIYLAFNIYDLFLNIFSNFLSIKFILFSIGLFLGIFLTSYLINYLFNNYKRETYLFVTSFLISSIFILIKNILNLQNFEILSFLLFLILGFVISKKLDK